MTEILLGNEDPQVKPADRLKAAEMLGKYLHLADEPGPAALSSSIGENARRTLEALAAALAPPSTPAVTREDAP